MSPLIILGVLWCNPVLAELSRQEGASFSVPPKLAVEERQLFIDLLLPDVFKKSPLSLLDVEDYSNRHNVRILVSKYAFSLATPVSDLLEMSVNKLTIKEIFEAQTIDPIDGNAQRIYIPMALLRGRPLSLTFEMQCQTLPPMTTQSARNLPFIQAVLSLDQNLPIPEGIIYSRQWNFNHIFIENISAAKIYKLKDATLLIAYSLTLVKESTCRKLDMIPFISAKEKISGLFTGILERGFAVFSLGLQ